MATDYLSRLLAGQGLGGTPTEEDGALVRRFLSARGRIRPEDEAADTAEVQRQLATRALAPDLAALDVPPPRVEKTSPAASAPTQAEADYNARRAAASRTALVNDVLSGATEGFDRATEWIAGRGPGVRARDRGAVEDAERRFLGQEAEREKRALAERNRPMVEAERAAALEKAKAETAKAKAATANTTADAAYEAALRDVNSPETQAMREFAVSVSAGKLPPELAARMNGIQLRDGAKLATSQLNAEALAGIQQQRLTQSAEESKAERFIRMRALETQIAALESLNENKRLDREQEKELANKKAELEREKIAAKEGEKSEKDSDADFKAEGELRRELQNSQIVKDFQLAGVGYDKVRLAAADASAAGDLALVFGYMKTIDPTSTVKESESASVENARGVDETVRNVWNKIRTGQRLTVSQRQEFIRSAETQYQAYKKKAKQVIEAYRRSAERNGLNPANVVLEGMYGDDIASKVGTAANPARSIERVPPPATLDEPEPETRRPVTKPAIAPGEEIPRLISLRKPDGTRKTRDEVKAEIAEGETARFPMGKGADGVMEYRTVKKVGGKIVPVKEGE